MNALILNRIDSAKRMYRFLSHGRAAGPVRALVPDARMGPHRKQGADDLPTVFFRGRGLRCARKPAPPQGAAGIFSLNLD
jgi:hypothetical protein